MPVSRKYLPTENMFTILKMLAPGPIFSTTKIPTEKFIISASLTAQPAILQPLPVVRAEPFVRNYLLMESIWLLLNA